MSLIKNKRLAREIIDVEERKRPRQTARERFASILSPIRDMERRRLIFCASIFVSNLICFIVVVILKNSTTQILTTVGVLLLDIVSCFVFGLFHRRRAITYVQVLAIFFSLLSIVSLSGRLISFFTSNRSISLNLQITDIKKESDLLLSTEHADVYLDKKNMIIYSISDTFGAKYINKSYPVVSEKSEYYFLYNVGMEIKPEVDSVSSVYLYPPTPHTTTGYDYLIEFTCNNVQYVARVFIPGVVDFNHNISSHMLDISYGENINTVYEVNKVDGYLLFQSEYSSFSTPFENVKYSENEFFYVRYNRYMRQYTGSDEVDEIEEENVRYINSVLVVSPTIKKVNFFWIGETVENVFNATTPVIEVVYDDGTSDIAIIKDINAGAVKTILGYR